MSSTTWPLRTSLLLALTVAVAAAAGPAVAHPPPARPVISDFTGDGKADLAVWNPVTGYWRFGLLCELRPEAGCGFSHGHLTVGDPAAVAVPGDYDGDGIADPAVFDRANGRWHIVPIGAPATVVALGRPGDLPAVADYNGDGAVEAAAFSPDGSWHWAGGATLDFGEPGDLPVPADYDGDGRADVAVFKPHSGTWLVLRSSDGELARHVWGVAGDRPAQADYDGDGLADLAVYRPSNAQWWLLLSSGGMLAEFLGEPGGTPVPDDYDGDGRAEMAVHHPAELASPKPGQGSWLIRGHEPIAFGTAGEVAAR